MHRGNVKKSSKGDDIECMSKSKKEFILMGRTRKLTCIEGCRVVKKKKSSISSWLILFYFSEYKKLSTQTSFILKSFNL